MKFIILVSNLKEISPRAVPEKSMSPPPPRRQLIFFSMGRRANENLNSVGGRFERNFNDGR